ncbi:hypothetical protein [Methylobacterium sp. CM6257]
MSERQATAIRRQISRLAVEIEQAEADTICPGRIEVLEALLEFHTRRLGEVAEQGDLEGPYADRLPPSRAA